MLHPDTLLTALETEQPYPIKMTYFYGSNPLSPTCYAEPERWYNALMKCDFNAAHDVFMTPTIMAVCDLVLPLAGFAAQDAVVLPHFGRNTHFLGAMNQAVDPGECKSDIEIDMAIGNASIPKRGLGKRPKSSSPPKSIPSTIGISTTCARQACSSRSRCTASTRRAC